MRILIVGGTKFVGRALVEAARARGHELTLFNRGETNPGLFPDVERIAGDRTDPAALGALAAHAARSQGRTWDAAIDTCGYVPRVVRMSAEAIAPLAGHYTFISTISVYDDTSRPGVDEDAPVGRLDDETVEEIDEKTYGPLKALCEEAAEKAMPGRVLTVRPGLIVGPHDPTDRFTYWPWRVARGGEVLAPGRPDRRIQVIDVRDLAEWTIRMIEERATGVFNATGPEAGAAAGGDAGPKTGALTMETVLRESKRLSGSDAAFTWVDEPFLLSQGVQEWVDLPLWIDGTKAENAGFYDVDCRRAVRRGLAFRPVTETIESVLAMIAGRIDTDACKAGISRERETELLAAWRSRRGAGPAAARGAGPPTPPGAAP